MYSAKKLSATVVLSSAVVLAVATPALACAKKDVKPVDHKVGICHATGSKTNPYVFITVDEHAVKAHQNHQDGRDIVGAKSAADCPKPSVPTPTPTPGKGQVLSTTQTPAQVALPTELPKTGSTAGLSALVGLPTLAV